MVYTCTCIKHIFVKTLSLGQVLSNNNNIIEQEIYVYIFLPFNKEYFILNVHATKYLISFLMKKILHKYSISELNSCLNL